MLEPKEKEVTTDIPTKDDYRNLFATLKDGFDKLIGATIDDEEEDSEIVAVADLPSLVIHYKGTDNHTDVHITDEEAKKFIDAWKTKATNVTICTLNSIYGREIRGIDLTSVSDWKYFQD